MNNSEFEEIKKLIKKGFDLEAISFEFDIPIEELEKVKESINTKQELKISDSNEKEEIDSYEYLKMKQIRTKYLKLYQGENESKNSTPIKIERKKLSQEEIEIINSVIKSIEEKVQSMKGLKREKRRIIAQEILEEIKSIEEYDLLIEQAEKLINLISLEQLQELNIKRGDKIDFRIKNVKRKIITTLAKAIDDKQREIEDVKQLKELEKKLSIKIVSQEVGMAGTVKNKIRNKISKIQQKQASDRIRNEISTEILQIVESLSNGKFDIEKANQIINSEIKKRKEKLPKGVFSLKDEQIKSQILIQIKIVIKERIDEYDIVNPEKMVEQIKQLCGENIEQAIRLVVQSLINRKKYETANELCNKFYDKKADDDIAISMRKLKREIRNAEIGNFILQRIKEEGSVEEDIAFYKLIEKRIEKGEIKVTAISLGKNKDGTKNISLENVWEDEKNRDKNR